MVALLLHFSWPTAAQSGQKADSSYKRFTYVRAGVDVASIIRSALAGSYSTYEAQLDANLSAATNLALEFGTGRSLVDNRFLRYSSSNTFLRIGVDKNFFGKEFKGDMDNAFVGIRYGLSSVSRQDAEAHIYDAFWGDTSLTLPGERFVAHWLELTGGFRMELFKHVFAGWNVRARTFINPKKFELLPPSYLAGFGRGDKNTSFGFNFYILYGLGKRN